MLERFLLTYLDGAGLRAELEGFMFRAALGTTDQLSERPMGQSDAYRMIRRRTAAAGIATLVGNHSFRATGITELLRNGKLEDAQWLANHESARTTGLSDRRDDDVTVDVVEGTVISASARFSFRMPVVPRCSKSLDGSALAA